MLPHVSVTDAEIAEMERTYDVGIDSTMRLPALGECWADREFRQIVCGFIKKYGYHSREGERKAQARLRQAEEAKKRENKKRFVQEAIKAKIPTRFYGSEKNAYDFSQWPASSEVFETFARGINERRGLYLFGRTGKGKSHFAAKTLLTFLKRGRVVFWIDTPRFISLAYDWHSEGSRVEFAAIRHKAITADIVVFDDFAKVSLPSKNDETVGFVAKNVLPIIEGRLKNRPTIFTDEKPVFDKAVQTSYTKSICNKINESCAVVEVK